MELKINKHDTVLVPIESWQYNSPLLKVRGKSIDVGLVAEALIYYDVVYLALTTVEQFQELLEWFAKQNQFNTFLTLVDQGVIRFFYYGFMTSAIEKDGIYSIWNVAFKKGNLSDFLRLIAYRADLRKLGINAGKQARLFRLLENKLIDESSDGYDPPVENARIALQDPRRVNLLTQAYIDIIYKGLLEHESPPNIQSSISTKLNGDYTIDYNFNFSLLDQLLHNRVVFRREMPIIGEAHSNRLIWTAAKFGWDLYLGDVMSTVVTNKLVESSQKVPKKQKIIKELREKVEFPDIYSAANLGEVGLEFILKIRRESLTFRRWLQQEGERDRDAILAYHFETAKAVGITKHLSSMLKMIGTFGQLGSPIASLLTPDSPALGVLTSSLLVGGSQFLSSIGQSLSKEWKPIIFGEWFMDEYRRSRKLC